MIRIISGICFAISVGMFFYKKSSLYISKGKFLNELVSFIAYVKDSVRYTRTDVLTIKNISAKKFQTLNFLTDGINKNCFGYEKEIEAFVNGLGKTDIKGQLELCERYYNSFKSLKEKEMEQIEKNSKAFGALGLFSATVFLVIFI